MQMQDASQPRQQQRSASPSNSSSNNIVCPRQLREDEAEKTDASSKRQYLDGVEMSRYCTDWPRTLDQRAKSYIAWFWLPVLHA
jgi:hypothetical protein